MKAVRGSLAAVLAVFVATGSSLFSAAEIKEELLGSQGRWLAGKLSPEGVHFAVLIPKGSRFAVVVDGVEGPRIDQMLTNDGQPFFSGGPEQATSQANSLPVVFSDDGTHHAYFAKMGGDCALILDGKEISRSPIGPYPTLTRLTFPRGAKLLHYMESDIDKGSRIVVNGQPGPWSRDTIDVITSPDGANFAYNGLANDGANTPWTVVNGKQVKYIGRNLQFTGSGAIMSIVDGQGGQALVANGKPIIQAVSVEPVWISPVGATVAAAVMLRQGSPRVLTINGTPVPATEGAQVSNVHFSPDGKRYAAVCRSVSGGHFIVLDGAKGLEYQTINDSAGMVPGTFNPQIGFTPDSSKFYYVAGTSQSFLVIGDEESDGFSGLVQPVVGGANRIGFTANDGARQFVGVDGSAKEYRGANGLGFSPDGARYAFVAGFPSGSLYVDGAELKGVQIMPFLRTNEPPLANLNYVFSPDGRHIAFPGGIAGDNESRGMYVDGKRIGPTQGPAPLRRPQFTPDGKHLYWIEGRATDSNEDRDTYWLMLDGQRVMKFEGILPLEGIKENWRMLPDGTLKFVARSGGELKRFEVTPPADGGVDALLAGGAPTVPGAAPTVGSGSVIPGIPGATGQGDSKVNPLVAVVAGVIAAAVEADKKDSAKPAAAPAKTSSPPVIAAAPAETPAEAAAAAAALTWQELANRPELWPAQVTVKVAMDFQGGLSVRPGQKVNVYEIRANEIDLSTTDGKLNFTVEPGESDALEVARAGYAKLTPKQRKLTFGSLVSSKELWPLKVKLSQTFDLGGGRVVRAGDEMTVLDFQAGKLLVKSEALNVQFHVVPQATDIMAQCRRFVEDDTAGPRLVATQKAAEERARTRGVVVTELDGRLVNAVTAKPQPLDEAALPKYIVFLRGSSTCSITRGFMPSMVKFYNEQKPRHPEFEVVYIMTESPADTGKFAREAGFSWRAVEYESTAYMPSVSRQIDGKLPQLIVMDRSGKVLANGIQNGAPAALNQLAALLR